MTVLSGRDPAAAPRGSVLRAFAPKPRSRPAAAATDARPVPRRPLRAVLRAHAGQIKDLLVSAAATGCATTAAFQWHPWAGWLATGLSLVIVDHAVDRGPGVSTE